jgi:hypothetical protein
MERFNYGAYVEASGGLFRPGHFDGKRALKENLSREDVAISCGCLAKGRKPFCGDRFVAALVGIKHGRKNKRNGKAYLFREINFFFTRGHVAAPVVGGAGIMTFNQLALEGVCL